MSCRLGRQSYLRTFDPEQSCCDPFLLGPTLSRLLARSLRPAPPTPVFAMSCSTARFSTLYARLRSSSRVGDATTTRSGPTPQSDTNHQHRGVRARIRRVAGCATPTGSAGHAGATANLKLTFHLDHLAGADHSHKPLFSWRGCIVRTG